MRYVTFEDVKARLKALGLGRLRVRKSTLVRPLPMPRHWSQDLGPERIQEIAVHLTSWVLRAPKPKEEGTENGKR